MAARPAVELRATRSSAASWERRSPRAASYAVNWGGLEGWHPVGVVGTLVGLAISPLLGALAALLVIRALRRLGDAARGAGTRRSAAGEWGMSAALAFSHGANDAQKSIGVIAALLLADWRDRHAGGADCG